MFAAVRALTKDQRAHVVSRLLEERKHVMRRLARYGSERAGEETRVNRVPLHMADVGSETMQETLDAAFASRDSSTLAEIDDALRRFYRNPAGFGRDERNGAPIAFERLDIIPWTRRA
jgi:RNA polymerase-binding transcription factor DksA